MLSGEEWIRCRLDSATLPVLLTAPHGGVLGLCLLERPSLARVVKKRDKHTIELLDLIDQHIKRRLKGHLAHTVVANFHRRHIDANRNADSPDEAAHHPRCDLGRQLHQQYHTLIERCLEHCTSFSTPRTDLSLPVPVASGAAAGGKIGNGWNSDSGGAPQRILHLDIHGVKKYSDFVVVGTNHGATCSKSLLEGENGFLWHLRRLIPAAVLPGSPSHTELF